jgi:hypothetical protein
MRALRRKNLFSVGFFVALRVVPMESILSRRPLIMVVGYLRSKKA